MLACSDLKPGNVLMTTRAIRMVTDTRGFICKARTKPRVKGYSLQRIQPESPKALCKGLCLDGQSVCQVKSSAYARSLFLAPMHCFTSGRTCMRCTH